MQAMTRNGCGLHGAISRATHQQFGQCPAGECRFQGSRDDLWYHIHTLRHQGNAAHRRLGFGGGGDGGAGPAAAAAAAPRRAPQPVRNPESALYSAAKSGDARQVAKAMSEYADPNKGGEDGFTPLMTAAEAGHAAVVRLLCQHPLTKINLTNTYGQTALSFAAQNGRLDTILELCAAKCKDGVVDFERRANTGMTAAAAARAAGHTAVADMIAGAARERQVDRLMTAVVEGAESGSQFDALSDRLLALFPACGLAAPAFADEAPDFEFDNDDSKLCIICMDAPIQAATVPCFHAQYCVDCAQALDSCAVCRGNIVRVQRIYLP